MSDKIKVSIAVPGNVAGIANQFLRLLTTPMQGPDGGLRPPPLIGVERSGSDDRSDYVVEKLTIGRLGSDAVGDPRATAIEVVVLPIENRFVYTGPRGEDELIDCPTCSGTGGYGFTENLRCRRCDGRGKIKTNEAPLPFPPRKECPRCEGRGTLLGAELGKSGRTPCPECGGYGFFILDPEGKAKEKQTPPIPVEVRKKLEDDADVYGNAFAMFSRGEWRRLDPLKVKLDLREKETADDPCPKCEGTGRKNGTSFPDPCPKCKGTGRA